MRKPILYVHNVTVLIYRVASLIFSVLNVQSSRDISPDTEVVFQQANVYLLRGDTLNCTSRRSR